MSSQGKCQVCGKPVYVMEMLVTEKKVFHKGCFRCQTCKSQLSLGKYASMDFKFQYYCKPCFKKAFFTKGNYSEGFGKLKPQQEWAQNQGKESFSESSTPHSTPETTRRASTTASEESVFTEADEREIEELINTRTLAELKSMYEDLLKAEQDIDASDVIAK